MTMAERFFSESDGDNGTCDTSVSAAMVTSTSTTPSSSTTTPPSSTTTPPPSTTNNNNEIESESDHPVDSDERIRRRLLNKHLKQRNKLRKYETRMQQAVFRKDLALEESARKDWEDHMQRLRDDPNSVLNYIAPLELKLELESGEPAGTDTDTKGIHNNSRCCQLNQGSRFRHLHPSLRSMDERDTQRVREGSAWILEFRQKLVPRILASHSLRENGNRNRKTTETTMQKVATTTPTTTATATATLSKSLTTKQRHTIHAAELKANMQQGTQTKSMFNDELAVLGYTRQKFHERAVLAFSSLDRLDPMYCGDNNEHHNENHNENHNQTISDQPTLRGIIWERLMATEQIISIGCGPGCDAVGVLGFLESHGVKVSNGIVLLDFVMDVWKELVLDTLIPMVVPCRVPYVRTLVCDVREPLSVPLTSIGGESDEDHALNDNDNDNETDTDNDHDNDNQNSSSTNRAAFLELTEPSTRRHRLVVVSYLLTETRQKWKSFFGHLLGLLKGTESLLLLTEPTAWQLHEFLRCFGGGSSGIGIGIGIGSSEDDRLLKAHVWLDSSRDLPHLQDLDKRNGPAILLVCTT